VVAGADALPCTVTFGPKHEGTSDAHVTVTLKSGETLHFNVIGNAV
jgi:hypothetical protein